MVRNPDYQSVVAGVVQRVFEKEQKLTYDETQRVITTLLDGGVQPTYHQQGDFTLATLLGPNGTMVAFGISKRNPTDQKLPLRGRALALSRAVHQFVDKFADACGERPWLELTE